MIQINSFYEFSTVEPLINTPSELSDIDIENVHGIGADTAMTLLDAESINIENVNVNLKIQGGRIC